MKQPRQRTDEYYALGVNWFHNGDARHFYGRKWASHYGRKIAHTPMVVEISGRLDEAGNKGECRRTWHRWRSRNVHTSITAQQSACDDSTRRYKRGGRLMVSHAPLAGTILSHETEINSRPCRSQVSIFAGRPNAGETSGWTLPDEFTALSMIHRVRLEIPNYGTINERWKFYTEVVDRFFCKP